MGRDLTLYPDHATKADLKAYLESMNFQRCEHFWDWPEGTLNYEWFDYENFKSIDGVSADIYPISDIEKEITGNGWALHVRNRYCATWHDVSKLNSTLRGARKQFGGTIKGDYGTNRYAELWEDESTPISRGVSSITKRLLQDMHSVKFALPDPKLSVPQMDKDDPEGVSAFIEFTKTLDPSRVIYNGLVPFAVSMFEHFFSSVFRILITYDSYAIQKRNEHKLKVDFDTLLKVSQREKTIEDIITGTYTFQNINQLNKAYIEWLGIDVKKLLYKKKRIGRRVSILENRIQEIIEYRHGVVHRFELDQTLTRESYVSILDTIEACMTELISLIESRYKVKIDKI